MGSTDVVATIRKLSECNDKRSDRARLRDIFHEIEHALKAGVSRKDLHEALLSHGFSITFRGFETALYKIRQELRNTANIASPPALNTPIEGSSITTSPVKETHSEDDSKLTPKQRREKLADQYIKPRNDFDDPVLKRILERNK